MCPKCGRKLYRAFEYHYGHRLDAINCPICGWMDFRNDDNAIIPEYVIHQLSSSLLRDIGGVI